jgi:hypothetical protein
MRFNLENSKWFGPLFPLAMRFYARSEHKSTHARRLKVGNQVALWFEIVNNLISV